MKSRFITSSVDSTVRIWDLEDCRFKNTEVISVKSKLPGGRSPITCTAYSPNGEVIVACAQDGSTTVWKANGPYINPIHRGVTHTENSGASGVAFAADSFQFVTRGLDGWFLLFG